MPDNLLAPARRARRNPLEKRDIDRVERDLKSLVADPQHARNRDREFSGFVSRQFSRVYGDGPVKRNASGRPARGTPLRTDIEVFRPKPRRSDLTFGRGVGPGEANKPADVMRAQRLLSNAGTFSFAVPQERSGRPSPTLTRATRAFQTSRGLAVDGRIAKAGETLRGLGTTLFAADGPKEGLKDPPKEEKPKDPVKGKKKECASLAQDLANATINNEETSERFRTANEGMIRTRKKIAALEKKLEESRNRNSGSDAVKGIADGIVQGLIKGRNPRSPALLLDGLVGAMKGIGTGPATDTESEKIRQQLEVERRNLTEFRRQNEFELSILKEIEAKISEIEAKIKALDC